MSVFPVSIISLLIYFSNSLALLIFPSSIFSSKWSVPIPSSFDSIKGSSDNVSESERRYSWLSADFWLFSWVDFFRIDVCKCLRVEDDCVLLCVPEPGCPGNFFSVLSSFVAIFLFKWWWFFFAQHSNKFWGKNQAKKNYENINYKACFQSLYVKQYSKHWWMWICTSKLEVQRALLQASNKN